MAKLVKKSPATDWLLQGIECIASGTASFLLTKERFFTAGKCFVKSKEACESTGATWAEFLAAWIADNTPRLPGNKRGEPPITDRTVRNYIALYNELTGLARELNPKGTEKEIEKLAIETMLDTPGGYLDVLRAVKLLRDPFGYDKDKYEQKKIGRKNEQIEFEFTAVDSVLDSLALIGTPKFKLKLPADKTRDQALEELEGDLQKALDAVKKERGTVNV